MQYASPPPHATLRLTIQGGEWAGELKNERYSAISAKPGKRFVNSAICARAKTASSDSMSKKEARALLRCFLVLIDHLHNHTVLYSTYRYRADLGTRQFFSFAKKTTRQRNRASEKFRQILRSRCLNGVVTSIIITNNCVASKHGQVVAAIFPVPSSYTEQH